MVAPTTAAEEEAQLAEALALSLSLAADDARSRTPSAPDFVIHPPAEPRPEPPDVPPPVRHSPVRPKPRPPMRSEQRPSFPPVGHHWNTSPLAFAQVPILRPVRPPVLLPRNGEPPRPERFAYFPVDPRVYAMFPRSSRITLIEEVVTDSDDEVRSDATSGPSTAPSHHYPD